MLRSYLAVALRNLTSNRLQAAINIGGLAVGLAACLLILQLVRDELSYERWWPHADRIAVVESTFDVPGREPMAFAGSPGPMGPALAQDFSSDLEQVARVYTDEAPVRVGDRRFIGRVAFVDAGFFDIFDLPVAVGDRAAALADNKSILLSRSTARKYFGDAPAVGGTLQFGERDVFTVVGVFADLPQNTHLQLDSIALLDPARYKDQPWVVEQWTSVNVATYVLLRSPGARARVEAGFPGFVDRNVTLDIPGFTEAPSSLMHFDLMPLLDVHLHASKPGYKRQGSFTAVVAFGGIALLILIIACINFVNLATARAMGRAREVAMRKVVGATRGQLVAQHLGEAVLTALVALVVALALVELALPTFNGFLHRQLRLDLLGDPTLLAIGLGLVIVVGAVGGLYPAVYLSRFRPAAVLKANQSSAQGSSPIRTALVVFQFAISIGLIACTATIYAQTVYARTLDLGFDHADRFVVTGLDGLPTKDAAATLEREVAALPGVEHAALSSDTPPLRNDNNTILYPTSTPGDEKLVIETVRVDPDFFATYGVAPIAGRLFDPERASDFSPRRDAKGDELTQSIVINQAFAAKLGAARPEDVIGTVLWEPAGLGTPDQADHDGPATIRTTVIGVVPDLYLRSVRTAVTPLLFYVSRPNAGFGQLTVHAAPGRAREVRKEVETLWTQLGTDVPIRTEFISEALSAQYDGDEQRGQIFAAFAAFAILIACLGLFGLASFAAQRRTKEIGMRKVLGASVLDIVRLLVWQFSRPVLVANLIAWPVSFYVMRRWLAGFRYAIDLTDPRYLVGVFGGASVLAMLVAWATTAGHAYRVARANPGRALRTE